MTNYKIEYELDNHLLYTPPYCNDCGGTGVIDFDQKYSTENAVVYCDCEAAIFYGYFTKKDNNE